MSGVLSYECAWAYWFGGKFTYLCEWLGVSFALQADWGTGAFSGVE